MRTAGLINPNTGAARPHGQYLLGGEKGKKGVFPLANVLTREVDVEPGSQLDGIVAFAFHWGNFLFDIGYNLYIQEAEDVKVKTWANDTYGIADYAYDTANDFTITTLPGDGVADDTTEGPINREQVRDSAAETPSQVTHKLYGGLGYAFNHWNYPLMVGIAGSYEWPENNAAMEQWAVWGKVGLSF